MNTILAVVAAIVSIWGIAVVIGAMNEVDNIYIKFAIVAAALGWFIMGLVVAGL